MPEDRPIITSLLDADFYKFTMGQFIWKYYPDTQAVFKLINRTINIRLADLVDVEEFARQLDLARELRPRKTELYYLRGMDIYGRNMFLEGYLQSFAKYQLPPYELRVKDGQFELTFSGNWRDVSMWETVALAILSELRLLAGLARMSAREADIMFKKAEIKLYDKLQLIKGHLTVTFSDFSTRRRNSFEWHEKAVRMAMDVLGPKQFVGTSNTLLAFLLDLIPIGTNAHELQMVTAALYPSAAEKRSSQYRILCLWQELYGDGLRVFLPDTFGTDQFLEYASDEIAHVWRGSRQDSGDPYEYGEKMIEWYEKRGVCPSEKLIIFSDGLDAETMIQLEEHFQPRIKATAGWGTLFANDFRGCFPEHLWQFFSPISIICKPVSAEGKPTVKLSDNIQKATGPEEAIKEYLEIFGKGRRKDIPVLV